MAFLWANMRLVIHNYPCGLFTGFAHSVQNDDGGVSRFGVAISNKVNVLYRERKAKEILQKMINEDFMAKKKGKGGRGC